MVIKRGITRTVFIINKWAIKLPTLRSWKLFLTGLLCNIQENFWWKASNHDSRLCPIILACPFGLFIVMEKAIILHEHEEIDWFVFDGLPVDPKPINVGKINGRLVLVDYGS